MILKRWVGLSS